MTARLRVSEAAQLAGVSASTLRAWESSGLIKPSRSGRYRWFSPRDIKDLQEIASLPVERRPVDLYAALAEVAR